MEGINSVTEIGNHREIKQSKRPLLGVMPRFIFEENRIRELQNAIKFHKQSLMNIMNVQTN